MKLTAARLRLLPVLAILMGPGLLVAQAQPARTSSPAGTPAVATAKLTVSVPQMDAELHVDGNLIEGSGIERTYETPPLSEDARPLTVMTQWRPNTYTVLTRSRTVDVRRGDTLTIDLSREDPNDRVRVIYVPTPDDVAREMVKLAGITPNDVVYEPGCGDARITIAAVKGGARRALGVDIDPARVEESTANVKAAGLEDQIDIRLGDALDVKNISSATVVFLYMGDHFNMLIRPLLWRELPVGARIVSHRFLMGDWKPDKTVSIASDSDGFVYELHLWTITEELKRRLGR